MGDAAMDRKKALFMVAALVALLLVVTAIYLNGEPLVQKDALVKKNISLKNKCPSPRPSVTIEPYRIPLPIMNLSERGVAKKG
jgi:hypothetical protein